MKTPSVVTLKGEIELLMKYAVPEDHIQEAEALLEKHAGDGIALNLMHNFYSYLPEAKDDILRILRLLARRQGAFLICATTAVSDYLYITTVERAVLLGPLADGIESDEILEFFGFSGLDSFLKLTRNLDNYDVYEPAHLESDLCTVCAAAHGEFHTLGCPVEVCPWCGGQLTYCNCRYTQLNLEQLNSESHIEMLQEKIEAAGRIPYDSGQCPTYPTMGDDNLEEEI